MTIPLGVSHGFYQSGARQLVLVTPTPETSLDTRVAASSDDAHEDSVGTVTLTDTVFPLGVLASGGECISALRWDGAALARGSTVTEAYARFHGAAENTAGCVVRIFGVDADDTGTYTTGASDITSRTKTTAYVDWDIPPWVLGLDNADTQTPNISSIVNELLARPGWVSGNAIGLVFELSPANTDATFPRRRAVAFDDDPDLAPRLLIDAEVVTPPPSESLDLRGEVTFNITEINDSVTDQFGVTHRGWYQRMRNSLASSPYDSDFNRNDNRPWCRQGNMGVTSLLVAFRYTGDLALLDEAVGLMELAWGNMTVDNGRRYWVGNDVPLDVSLASGLVACVAWACRNNDDLTSPAGHNYGAIATKYHDWLVDDFLPHWEVERNSVGDLPVIKAYWGHSWANEMRLYHYVGKLGGGNGHTPAEYAAAVTAGITLKLADDRTGTEGSTDYRVTRHFIGGSSDAGKALQYTTYVRYEITAWLDLALDGADARLDETFFQEWANSLNDFSLDGDPEGTGIAAARTIGGDLKPDATSCTSYDPDSSPVYKFGIIYNHCFSYRVTGSRLATSAYVLLAGYDDTGSSEAAIHAFYPSGGTTSSPDLPDFTTGRVINFYKFGS